MEFDTSDNSLDTTPDHEVSSGNPAWNDVLSEIPQEYHQALTPKLQEWDQGVNKRFQQIHEEYKPYKSFKEAGYDPDQINMALGIMDKLENDPQFVYSQLEGYLQSQGLLGQEEDEYEEFDDEDGDFDDPRFDELFNGFGTLAEAYLADQQAKQEAEEDAALENELNEMREKYAQYGDFDEDYVLTKMASGMDTEDAVKSYYEFVNRTIANRNRPPAPRIIGSAGAFPGQQAVDPGKLNDKDRKALVTDILNSMNDF